MKIGVLGTGTVGRTLAAGLAELGHTVTLGTRDVAATLGRKPAEGSARVTLADWHTKHPAIEILTFAQAAAGAELVINATSGGRSLDALELAKPESLKGKILIDVANPLVFAHGMPPTLFVKNTDSLAERIQRAYPDARVVKTLNTVSAAVIVDPASLGGGDHSIFLSGNDAAAKTVVADLLRSFGWRDIVDLGDITTARGAEMLLPLWVRLFSALGTPKLNVKVVR